MLRGRKTNMSILSIDFETRSTVDLKKSGVYVYAEHAHTDVWCMAYAFDDDDPSLWVMGEACPGSVRDHIARGGECRAWNAQFERTIWREIMRKRYGWIGPLDSQWVCTAAEAAAMALPRQLEMAARVLGVAQQKDSEGHDLMLRMARPRRVLDDGTPVWWDNSGGRLDKLYAYCKQDVRTERACVKALRRLTPHERQIYLLDQRNNDRGIMIDRALVEAAQGIASEGFRRAEIGLVELTGGEVTSITNNKMLTNWIREQGVETSGVSKPAVQEMLERDIDPMVREALQIRSDAGRTSIAKLGSMLACACRDGALRGLLLYHAASTGRWAGRLVQPQNFPRGDISHVTHFIEAVLAGDYEYVDLFYHPVAVISALLRSMLVARDEHDLIAGDFSAIEARVLNWLAGQEDVLAHFRAYDAGDRAHDPYVIMASRMGEGVGRQTGKAAELGCGFQMGAKKFIDAAWKVYQVRVTKEQARSAVTAYRSSHKKVVDLWYEVERACLDAMAKPGTVFPCSARNVKIVVAGAYLYIILPSGRPLCYAAPRAVEREVVIEDEEGNEKRFTKVGMEYNGVDSLTKQWGTQRAYGGFLVENIVQAVARDLMADAMLRIEAAHFPPLLSVHDEIVCEIENDLPLDPLPTFKTLLEVAPAWAQGCPIAAEVWRGTRYRK